jgi:hypothetical protein
VYAVREKFRNRLEEKARKARLHVLFVNVEESVRFRYYSIITNRRE